MLGTDMLTFQEFMLHESLPLSTIHQAVFAFLRDRDDVVVFGAQAVNAYVSEPRMTQQVDLLLTFPELKDATSLVTDCLKAAGADGNMLTVWHELVQMEIAEEEEEDEF